MTKQDVTDLGTTVFAAAVGTGISTFIFEAIGTFFLGLLSAAGAYLCTHVLIPYIKKWYNKKTIQKEEES